MGKFQTERGKVDPKLLEMWEEEQRLLRPRVSEVNHVKDPPKVIAGVDISASQKLQNIAVASLVITDYPPTKTLYEDSLLVKLTMPYVPGLLAFRELGPILELFRRLMMNDKEGSLWPDLILTDGNGILHVNQFGLACHLGVLLDIPCAGCGKTMFYIDGITKQQVAELSAPLEPETYVELKGDSGKVWGAAVRVTADSKNPMIVSVGHKVDLATAVKIVLGSCKFRVPEPVRLADKLSRGLIDKAKEVDALTAPSFHFELEVNAKKGIM